MINSFDPEVMFNTVKSAFAPMTDAFKNFPAVEVPEAARDFVKKAAGTAKDRAAEMRTGSEEVTSAIETAVSGAVTEATKMSRDIRQAVYDDTQALFAGVDKLASAKTLNEVFAIQNEFLRSQGDVVAARAKAAADHFGKLFADSTKVVQDSFAKAASFTKPV